MLRLRRVSAIDVTIAAGTLAGLVLVAGRAVVFGSHAGQWVFRYVAPLRPETVAVAILGAPVVLVVHELARRRVDARPALVVPATFAGGIALQLGLHRSYPYPLAKSIVSDVSNGFYGAAARVGPLELLRDFERIAPGLPRHARVNMPGKVLFFHLLRVFTDDPGVLAVAVVATASLAGVLLYGIATSLFGSRRLGIDAMVLWFLVPALISVYPMLNVVSPVLPLAAVLCMTRFLDRPRAVWAVAAGVLAYGALLFDPLALLLGVVFAPAVPRAVLAGRVRTRDALDFLIVFAVALAAVGVAVRLGTGFDAWKRLRQMAVIAQDFNRSWARSYDVWLTANVKDVVLAVGPAVTLAVVAACGRVAGRIWRAGRQRALAAALAAGPMVTLMTVTVLATLVILCLNRGEVARLWLFLFAPMQVVTAWWCAERPSDVSRRLVVAGTFAYAAVTVATVGYCIP